MRSMKDMSRVSNSSYLAAEGDYSAPEDVNPYLLTLMAPDKVGGIPLPDLNSTPYVMKTFLTELVQTWQAAGATLMLVWTPASPTTLLKLFVQVGGGSQPWGWLADVPLSQPLNLNYQKARLVSAGLKVRSASQAAGVFTLAGEATSVYVNTLPPFKMLNYNSLLSWAPNSGSLVKGVPVQKGTVSNWIPNGFNDYWNPESAWSYQFKELWDYEYVGVSGGWAVGPWTIAVGASQTIWDTDLATTPFPFGSLPDPFYGDWAIRCNGNFTASTSISLTFRISFYAADPATWTVTLQSADVAKLYYSFPGSNKIITANLLSKIFTTTQNITRIVLFATNIDPANPCTLTQVSSDPPSISIISYDYYRPNVMSPAVVEMVTMVNAGQPVHLSATYNYQLVPNPNLSRNISVTTGIPDDLLYDAAIAVMAKVGKGVQMVWDCEDYEHAFMTLIMHEIASGRTSFEAAGPTLRSRLMSLWKTVNPYLSDMAITGGKAAGRVGLAALSLKAPMLAPIAGYVADEYLSAPPDCDDGEYEAMDADRDDELVVARPKGGPIVVASDFINIVNGKSEPLTTPRVAHFAIVPGADNVTGDAKVLRVVVSSTPLGNRNYMRTDIPVTGTRATFSYTSYFYTKDREQFLIALVSYGVRCGVIPDDAEVYFSVDTNEKIRGPSYQLACLMALLGIAGPSIYSGGVDFSDQFQPKITAIGAVAEKASLAKRHGSILVAPAEMTSADLQQVMQLGQIGYPGYLCSGLPLPPNMVMLAISSPFDVVLYNLRVMKHRINMTPEDQMATGNVKVKPKTAKASEPGLEDAKQDALEIIEEYVTELRTRIVDAGLQDMEIGKSLQPKAVGWRATITNSGTKAAVRLQSENISIAYNRFGAAIERAIASGQGKIGKRRAKAKESSRAHKDYLLSRLEFEDLGTSGGGEDQPRRSGKGKKGESSGSGSSFVADLDW